MVELVEDSEHEVSRDDELPQEVEKPLSAGLHQRLLNVLDFRTLVQFHKQGLGLLFGDLEEGQRRQHEAPEQCPSVFR